MSASTPDELRRFEDRTYPATLVNIVDGDTVDILIDVGFGITCGSRRTPARVRFAGINAPELATAEGQAARTFLVGLVDHGAELDVDGAVELPA